MTWHINDCTKIAGLEVACAVTWTAWSYIALWSGRVSFSFSLLTTLRCPCMQPGLLQPSLPLLTSLRRPGFPGMLSSLCSVFCLSKFMHACSLLTCLCSSVSTVLYVSDWSLSFAAVLLVIVISAPKLFVASGKPSGSPSAVVVFLFVEILIPDRSLSFAAVYVVGRKAPM